MAEILSYTASTISSWNETYVGNMLYNIIGKHDERFSFTSGSDHIRVNDSFNLTFDRTAVNWNRFANLYVKNSDGTSTVQSCSFQYLTDNTNAGTWNVRLIRDTHLYYVEFVGSNGPASFGGVFFWANYNNKNYVGAMGSSLTYSTRYIESMTIGGVETEITTYSIKKIANYSLGLSNLFFTPLTVLLSSTGTYDTIEGLYSTSNLTYKNTISTNNKNYYALGTNTVIEIDSD